MKTSFKIFLGVIAMIGILGGVYYARENGMLDNVADMAEVSSSGGDKGDKIVVGSVTWGGHVGCPYFNGGFKPSKGSRYYKEYGILVDFKVNDDFAAQQAAFRNGKIDVLWTTADAFAAQAGGLADLDPKVFLQVDWSRGGDALVVMPGINSVSDLRGKKVAVAYGTPSHTLILKLLKANGMKHTDVQFVSVPSAIDAAAAFKARSVQAAAVWSPDDEDCVNAVPGSKILTNTKTATHIISDVMYAKASYIEANLDALVKLAEGWLRGNAEINASQEARAQAAQILANGLGMDLNWCAKAITNVRLTTKGDNDNFFGINTAYNGVKAEALYTEMGKGFQACGVISSPPPAWRSVSDTRIIRQINLSGAEHMAESSFKFAKATSTQANAAELASKNVTINFATGSSQLSGGAKFIIDDQLAPMLLAFANARVRLEGNTDKTGSHATNKRISQARAQAIATYLIDNYGFDPNRFIVVGNGPDNPVCYQDTPDCYRQNRRTECKILK